jgi:hypothetical protein
VSAAEVHAALQDWAARLVSLGAVVAGRLRPGLAYAEAVALAAHHGYDLSEDVAALWTWRDGAATAAGLPPAHLAPGQEFAPLDASLRRSREYHEASLAEARGDRRTWQAHWVVAVHGHALPLVLDGSRPGPDTFRHDPHAHPLHVARSPLAQRVARWHEMVDTGTWRVARDGTWDVDLTHLPAVPHAHRQDLT